MTNIPIQLSWLKPNGNLERLFYMSSQDTLAFPFKTNHHIVVSYQGYNAVSVFVPGFDKNICKVHDKQFNKPKKIKLKKFRFKSDEIKQQKFKYKPETPAYKKGSGPAIFIDQSHANPNLQEELYAINKALLNDGYNVKALFNDFSQESLKDVEYLILPQPLTPTVNGWKIDSSSAFTTKEYQALFEWVENGGNLIVLSDYTPLGNRLEPLYEWLGCSYINGVLQSVMGPNPTEYNAALQSLVRKPYLDGRNNFEAIETVFSYGGGAISPGTNQALLQVTSEDEIQLVQFFGSTTKTVNAKGLCQGVYNKKGSGQVIVFSNLGMFQSWIHEDTGNKIGMNNHMAYQNTQYFLNVIHALQGFISLE